MISADLVKATAALPAIRQLLLPEDQGGQGISMVELKKNLQLHVPMAISAVALAHEWDFSARTETNVTTVSGTSEYTMTGDDRNCQQVISVTYGDDEAQIASITYPKLREIQAYSTPSPFQYWVPEGRASGTLPRIKIVGTPDAGSVLTYRFYRSDIDIMEIPSSLNNALELALARTQLPGVYWQAYNTAIAEAITSLERGTGSPRQGQMDSTTRFNNLLRSSNNDGP